jgi:hypothetical protein
LLSSIKHANGWWQNSFAAFHFFPPAQIRLKKDAEHKETARHALEQVVVACSGPDLSSQLKLICSKFSSLKLKYRFFGTS